MKVLSKYLHKNSPASLCPPCRATALPAMDTPCWKTFEQVLTGTKIPFPLRRCTYLAALQHCLRWMRLAGKFLYRYILLIFWCFIFQAYAKGFVSCEAPTKSQVLAMKKFKSCILKLRKNDQPEYVTEFSRRDPVICNAETWLPDYFSKFRRSFSRVPQGKICRMNDSVEFEYDDIRWRIDFSSAEVVMFGPYIP